MMVMAQSLLYYLERSPPNSPIPKIEHNESQILC